VRRARRHDERASYNYDRGENKAEAAFELGAVWRTLLHEKPGVVSHFLDSAELRSLQRFVDERLPPLTEVALAASALAELRHGMRGVGVEALKFLLRR
jgi:hypothetical protein